MNTDVDVRGDENPPTFPRKRKSGQARSPSAKAVNLLVDANDVQTAKLSGEEAPEARLSDAALSRLLAWTSPSYPTGAFSYSHGLEWAVEQGPVRDVSTLLDYVGAVLERGGGWIDAVLFVHAHARVRDPSSFDEIAELAVAFRGSSETALESQQQGSAFLAVTRKAWPHPLLEAFAARNMMRPVAQCIAMALACAAHDIPCAPAIGAWLHATAANLVSAGVRLIPLGQTDGQIAIARLAPRIDSIALAALQSTLDELGTASPLLEICSIRHETQYTRLFRS